MLVAELQELEEVRSLVTNGQQLGVLTFGDVATAVSEVELDESDVEDLYGHLEKNGIELVEDLDPAQKSAAEAERADGKRGRKRQKALDLKPDMTTDSLQLFLKDIGKLRLLTAAEEVELAKRIERGDLDAKQKMVESNLRLVVSIAKNYRNQGMEGDAANALGCSARPRRSSPPIAGGHMTTSTPPAARSAGHTCCATFATTPRARLPTGASSAGPACGSPRACSRLGAAFRQMAIVVACAGGSPRSSASCERSARRGGASRSRPATTAASPAT
jgi:hypothetical protein